MFDKLPPQSIEYEESILSSALLGSAQEVVEALSPGHFYRSAHRCMFDAIAALVEQKVEVDSVTVYQALMQSGDLEKVGGASFIYNLTDKIPIAVNVAHYAQIIREKAALRNVIDICISAASTAYTTDNPTDLIDKVQSEITSVDTANTAQDAAHIRDISVSVSEEIQDRYENPEDITGVLSGFNKLDRATRGFQGSDFILLAARPSLGKTALMLNMVQSCAKAGVPADIYSLEMSKKQLLYRMMTQKSKVDLWKIQTGRMAAGEYESVVRAQSAQYSLPIHIDDQGGLSISEFKRRARRAKKDHDTGIIFIDYLQLMSGDKAPTRDREVASISMGIKNTAKELDIPIIALSQLNRKLEERTNKRPQLSDLRDSGTLEQDTDVCLFLYRPAPYIKQTHDKDGSETAEFAEDKNKAELNIAKQRNGPTGVINMLWQPEITSFENITYI